MDEKEQQQTIQNKVNDLLKQFRTTNSPQYAKLNMLVHQTQETHKKLQKSIQNLTESLDYLRICIKYHLFDLEATRRENRYLRKLLEEKDAQ